MLRKDMTFVDPGPTLSRADVDAAMQTLALGPWPQDYVQYMLRFNGAVPSVGEDAQAFSAQLVRVWWPADTLANAADHLGLFSTLYAIVPRRHDDLVEVNGLIRHLLPPDTLAFGDGAGGSRFLFDLRADRFGEVLFWDNLAVGDDDDFAVNPYHNVAWVATDFIDFLNRLEPEPTDLTAWEHALEPDATRGWRSR